MAEPDEPTDWIERAVRIGGALGFDRMRLRWKLMRWRDQRERSRENRGLAVAHARYAHAVCAECGKVQPRGTPTCLGCGAPLGPHWMQVVRRFGFISPVQLNASLILAVLIVACFVRQCVFAGSAMGFEGVTLLRLGAHYPPLEWAGEWWRLGTAVFLHGGLMHVAFNVIALLQIGPVVEHLFGRGKTIAFFVVTGLLGFMPSTLMHGEGMSIGASGAVMGLVGVGAGWGQRDGTTVGRATRNQLMMWLVYTTIFGLMFHVDHVAHFAGFIAGFVPGYLVRSKRMGGGSVTTDFAWGLAATLVALVFVALVFVAPGRDLGF